MSVRCCRFFYKWIIHPTHLGYSWYMAACGACRAHAQSTYECNEIALPTHARTPVRAQATSTVQEDIYSSSIYQVLDIGAHTFSFVPHASPHAMCAHRCRELGW